MGLTELKLKDLKDKEFDTLYTKHKADWVTLANHAFTFAKDRIAGGNVPRADDILKALSPMLEVNELLRKHQEDVHARYKRFREFFGEYIIDQVFGQKEKK